MEATVLPSFCECPSSGDRGAEQQDSRQRKWQEREFGWCRPFRSHLKCQKRAQEFPGVPAPQTAQTALAGWGVRFLQHHGRSVCRSDSVRRLGHASRWRPGGIWNWESCSLPSSNVSASSVLFKYDLFFQVNSMHSVLFCFEIHPPQNPSPPAQSASSGSPESWWGCVCDLYPAPASELNAQDPQALKQSSLLTLKWRQSPTGFLESPPKRHVLIGVLIGSLREPLSRAKSWHPSAQVPFRSQILGHVKQLCWNFDGRVDVAISWGPVSNSGGWDSGQLGKAEGAWGGG